MRGPGGVVTIADAKLVDLFSVGPILEGIGLNVTAWSYDGRLNFSLLGCPDLVADLRPIARALLAGAGGAAHEQVHEGRQHLIRTAPGWHAVARAFVAAPHGGAGPHAWRCSWGSGCSQRPRCSVHEARRRGETDERPLIVVTGGLVGGAIFMRLGTWLQHVDLRQNASLAEQWAYGNRSILGGLVGAWAGVHVAKRLSGYPLRTGDLFAPAVALGMAVGRIGCLLTERRLPTGSSGGHLDNAAGRDGHAHTAAPVVRLRDRLPRAAFAVIWWWLRHRGAEPSFVWYLGAYGIARFLLEYVRGNEVAWLGLTRPQLFLAVTVPLSCCGWSSRCAPWRLLAPRPRSGRAREHPHPRTRHAAARLPHPPLRQRVLPAVPRRGPDRPLAEVQRLSGWLAERDGRIWLERGCPSHGLVRTLYDESPEILTYLEQWTAPDEGAHAGPRRQLRAGPSAYERRPAGDADPAHLHPARGPHRPLQPALPDLLRRLGARRWPGRAARRGARLGRRAAARENGRIDVLMLVGGEPTLYPWLEQLLDDGRRPADRADPDQHQRAAIAQDDALLETAEAGTASASRSTCSTTARPPRRPPTTAAPTSAGSRSARSTGSPTPASSPPSR